MMRRFLGELRMGEKSKNGKPVVHAHNHDAFVRQTLAILPRLGCRSDLKAAAVDPHHHGEFAIWRSLGSPDIQIEAVFARPRVAKPQVAENISLHAMRAKLSG